MGMKLQNVNYIYGAGTGYEKQALKNINLEIRDGEFLGIAGHTGSGKSTLTKLLNGLEKPSAGEIFYGSRNIHDRDFPIRELRGRVGLVFQYPEHQLFETSVQKDVEFGPQNLGLETLDVELRAYRALKLAGVGEELWDASPYALSGGQKRRVAIAGVLAMKPDILILDEPTAGLDPCGRTEILELLARLQREEGLTVILVSHSMEEISQYAGRIVVLNQGEIVVDGAPGHVFRYEKELQSIGLDVPQCTSIVHELEQYGMPVPQGTGCNTPEETADVIAKWLK